MKQIEGEKLTTCMMFIASKSWQRHIHKTVISKKMKKIVIILILGICSCGDYKESNEIPFFYEKELSFLFLKDGYDVSNTWIKQPANIEMLHETFKEIGYLKILEHLNWTEDWTLQIDNRKSLKNLIDSIEITYQNKQAPKYYREFWERRIKEGNEQVVYKVISEIKSISLGEPEPITSKSLKVNDTLKYLGLIELKDSLNNYEANQFLNKLIDFKLHQSVWNVRSGENYKFDNIEWDKQPSETYEKLKESDKYMEPWIKDNTK